MIDVNELIKTAMKARNKTELRAYQNIKAEIQKNQTAKGARPLTNELQLQIIGKYSRSLEDAIKQFSDANREDLVSEYTNELEVVKKLLPEPVSSEKIVSSLACWVGKNRISSVSMEVVAETKDGIIRELKFSIPKKEMGSAIKYLKSKFPTADGKMISDIVKKYVI